MFNDTPKQCTNIPDEFNVTPGDKCLRLLEILNWMFRLPEPPRRSGHAQVVSTSEFTIPAPGTLDHVQLQIHQSFATIHLVSIIEKSCSAVIGNLVVPNYGKSNQDVMGIRGFILQWSLDVMDAVLKAGPVPDIGAPLTSPKSNEASSRSSLDYVFSLQAPHQRSSACLHKTLVYCIITHRSMAHRQYQRRPLTSHHDSLLRHFQQDHHQKRLAC